ncbi:P-loop NTPase fold protein [Trichormus variabilis]|uniref:P-loop NTPase fold protein n=1 Tax=Anabaena variabilis TaxID=264691 RepID=UPI0016874CDD|nr:P-loop NTPase fold protein [Trichormus variabilis]MBD2629466.1 hypothetical protein [Trichormus variabilis FACHB-164]
MEAPQGQQEISSQQFIIPEIEIGTEAGTPEPEKPFAEFQSAVRAVAISPHGRRRIAVGLEDGTIEIWDVLTGKNWSSCKGHTSVVNSVAFSPDSSMVVSGSDDNTVRLWDAKIGEAIGQPLSGHTYHVSSVAFSPDGSMVVSGSFDKTLRLWNIKTGEAIGEPFSGHTNSVNSVAFSPDGKTFVSGSFDNTVRLWDIETGEAIGQPLPIQTNAVTSVAFNPDGSMVVIGTIDNTVQLWNIKTGKADKTFSYQTNAVNSVAFSPDGSMVVSGSTDETVRLWDINTGTAIGQPFIGHTDSVNSVVFSPDGSMVVSGSDDKTLRLWDVETGEAIGQLFSGHTDYVWSAAFSPDGSMVVSGSTDETVRLWDINTGTAIGQPFCVYTNSFYSVAFSPDGSTLVSSSKDNTVQLWDVNTGEAMGQPFSGHTKPVLSVAFSPDGSTLVSGSADKTLRLWDVETGEAIGQPFSGHKDFVHSVAFSPDGNIVVSGSWDKTLRLWDVNTGEAMGQPFSGHTYHIYSVAFSPDGSMVVSGSKDNTMRLWDVNTGEAIGQPFSGHTSSVISVAFSPDGSTVVSGSDDKTVRLWDISDPQRKRQIEIGKHQGKVYSVAFDPLGDYIISAGEDGIKIWRWQRFNIRRVPQPFRNDQPTGEDSLDVAKELQSLADVLMLRSLEPPLAVAILGSWGSGKSFGMHLIEKQITKIRCQQITAKQTWGDVGDEPNLSPYVGHVYQIKFNAWSYAKSDLWASLMQTIFDQLDRQLTLEKQLREVGKVSDLAGGEIWSVLNQMNDSERKTILEDKLSEEVFAELKEKNADGNALWDILSEVRQEEQEKLKRTEEELQRLEAELKTKNQELEREFKQKIAEVEREVDKDKEIIERKVNQEFENTSIVIVFLTQLKELSKDDFGDSIFKDFLNYYGFENRENLEAQIPIVKELDKLEESNLIDQVENLIKNKDSTIEDIIQKSGSLKNYVEQQPSKIVGLIEFIKKEPKTIFIFVAATSLPFIFYSVIIYILPNILPLVAQISSNLKLFLTTIYALPVISFGRKIYKNFQFFQAKISRLFKVAKESVEQEKQKLAAEKDQKIKAKIDEQDFEEQKNQVYQEKEAAKQALTTEQQEIEKLQAQVERQKQLVGLTAQYTSLVDFVNNRLEEDSYQKMLGLMHQIQDDLADLSEHLTYQPGKTHPEKLKVLKEYFPRGPARIVLYIDDLDRCPPDKVVEVLEAVQLLLNTNIFIIVLAIDDRYIGRALEHNYRGVLKRGGTPSGVDYLEKIIQIPYRMRPISKDVTASYLKSLVDIEEETKQENQNISNSQPVIQKSIVLEQRIEHDESKILLEDGSKLLLEDEQVSDISYQDSIEEYPVETEEKIPKDDISESTNKKSNSEPNNKKNQHSSNTDPLVSFERFTAEEFAWISESCQHVDLTPRTAKRLINICKIIKIIWTPVLHDTTWKQEPKQEYKQTLIAFLALAGRYPQEIRKILEEIYLEFEETDEDTVIIEKDDLLNRLQNQDGYMDSHNQREWKKFKNDFQKMSPQDKFYFETRTLNLAISFCFVGDIGYDPDDHYNREHRFENRQKDYDFYRDNV